MHAEQIYTYTFSLAQNDDDEVLSDCAGASVFAIIVEDKGIFKVKKSFFVCVSYI